MRFGTRLFPPGCSQIQKTVVTIFVFHGYGRAGREADDFLMRGLSFSRPASICANAGSNAMKRAKQKRPGEQRFPITSFRFPIKRCVKPQKAYFAFSRSR